MRCAEVIKEPAALAFSLAHTDSLAHAVERAVARWQAGEHRLDAPRAGLRYDSSVAVHVRALLALADSH